MTQGLIHLVPVELDELIPSLLQILDYLKTAELPIDPVKLDAITIAPIEALISQAVDELIRVIDDHVEPTKNLLEKRKLELSNLTEKINKFEIEKLAPYKVDYEKKWAVYTNELFVGNLAAETKSIAINANNLYRIAQTRYAAMLREKENQRKRCKNVEMDLGNFSNFKEELVNIQFRMNEPKQPLVMRMQRIR